MYGVPDSGVHYDGTRAFFKEVRFCYDYRTDKRATTVEALHHVAAGVIRLDVFTTHHFKLDQLPEAMRLVVDHPEQIVGAVIHVG